MAKAIKPYEQAIATAQAEALTKEKTYQSNLLKAEQNANQKIKAANDDAVAADRAVNSLSKQLSEAKRSLSTAPRETIIKYVNTSSDILKECVVEYRTLAEAVDGHAVDVGRLTEGWPD